MWKYDKWSESYPYTNSDGELILLHDQKLETPWTLC